MSTQRIVGYREGLDGAAAEVTAWVPRPQTAVAALPPLPPPPPRPPRQRGAPDATVMEEPLAAPATDSEQRPTSPRRAIRPDWIEEGSINALVWEHPQETARAIRTALQDAGQNPDQNPSQNPSQGMLGPREAGIFLAALGTRIAGEVVKWLGDADMPDEVVRAISTATDVDAEQERQIMDTFAEIVRAGRASYGTDAASAVLEIAFGKRRAGEIVDRVAVGSQSLFPLTRQLAPESVVPFIACEHPQTIALVLAQLGPAQAAGILQQLPDDQQKDVSYRIATMGRVVPAAIRDVERAIESAMRDVVGGNQPVGGAKVLADIINFTGSSTERALLQHYDEVDAQMAEIVRNQMFTFADLENLGEADLQVLLRECAFDDWVIALKATHQSLKARIQANVDTETWQKFADAMEVLGPMRAREVELVQLRIVQQVRQFEEQGRVTIVRGETETWL